ncbi:MAG: bifunctional (p)ppGpp synthetase/guanosine-3',5'-bis(diphosphate) 3'-pyrophosphohydrolase [Spirochaetales bacterium]|nr:bifunctional (p)ppGpp synthetase/guanosine-3',5'-bis(diphosphate) 3'-pyrophosphohydrolase [Spirochaetales bacterium]
MSAAQQSLLEFKAILDIYSNEEQEEIMAAARWAEGLHHNQKRASGKPYIIHPIEVARILVSLRLDSKAIIAALLHDIIEDTSISRKDLRQEFGKEVETLVAGVTKISSFRAQSKSVQAAETIRKMLFAMVKDIRVILIKLADKLHNMRTLGYLREDKQKRIATECLDIYAPLAGRLGISWVKDELEDLSLKYLRPEIYKQIKETIAEKKGERKEFLIKVELAIKKLAEEAGIVVEIKTRAKHFYSIFQKLKKQGKSISEIYDLLGIRILCNTPAQCYTLLGLVHQLWMPIAGRFKDYIAMPKSNRYQSLHTTVMCYGGTPLEIQIRTHGMDQTAENGVAAHWLYKTGKGFSKERATLQDLPIINKLKRWDGGKGASENFLQEIKDELLKDTIYVFTPGGDVVEMPKGASAVDFAYHIHTEVGNHTMAAKADGTIIPLQKALKNGQIVEIVTAQNARPHLNWLKYAQTARARSKIRHWLNQNEPSLIIDQNIIAVKKTNINEQENRKKKRDVIDRIYFDKSKVGVVVEDEKNMLIRFAGCCSPKPGDAIVGYISRGRGIIIHRASCRNLSLIREIDVRKIHVQWETFSTKFTSRFKILARHTSDIYYEIEGAIKKFNGHVIEMNFDENQAGNLVGFCTVELNNQNDLQKVLKSLRILPTILNIQQIGSILTGDR